MKKLIDLVEVPYIQNKFPRFSVGDTVRVWTKIIEGENQRLQPFEGTVIRIRGTGMGHTFTVRKTSFGIGIERIFPSHSPNIEKIELLRIGKVRRARLYYLRKVSGRSARIEFIENTVNPNPENNDKSQTNQVNPSV